MWIAEQHVQEIVVEVFVRPSVAREKNDIGHVEVIIPLEGKIVHDPSEGSAGRPNCMERRLA
jgi:hypothetical protein